jgi:DNA-binding HxlR family transcriptional regulator
LRRPHPASDARGGYELRYAAGCPTRQALGRIADKWTVLIVGLLADRPHRFAELRRGIDGISQKMLTQTLRSLELDGLVHRRVTPTVPVTVEYSLTATGRTLCEPLEAVRRWAERHMDQVLAARSRAPQRPAARVHSA